MCTWKASDSFSSELMLLPLHGPNGQSPLGLPAWFREEKPTHVQGGGEASATGSQAWPRAGAPAIARGCAPLGPPGMFSVVAPSPKPNQMAQYFG